MSCANGVATPSCAGGAGRGSTCAHSRRVEGHNGGVCGQRRPGGGTAPPHWYDQEAAQLLHTGTGLAAPTVARNLHIVLVIYVQLCQLPARVFFAQVHCEAVRTRLAIACAGAPENRIALGRFEGADKRRLVRRCARQKCLPLCVAEHGAHLPRNARPRRTDEGAPALVRALARHQTPREQAAAEPEGRKHALGAPAVRDGVQGERNVAPWRR